nr:ATP-binding protein [Caldalkalibacillus salinus]
MKPVDEITALIQDLTKGYYWRRIYTQETGNELHALSANTNELAQQLQRTTEEQVVNENRLQALIRHMASGLMFINHKGRVAITNEKVKDILQWEQDYVNLIYYEAPLPEDIITMVKDAFAKDHEVKNQLTMNQGIHRKIVELSVAPVKDLEGKTRGIVLLFYDITDLKKLEQVRADFVANVSHELKTPLTSIKGFSETLLSGAMYSEEHLKAFLEIIHKESDRLYRLIQDLLHLSHIEQNRFSIKWENVDIKQVLEDLKPSMLEKAKEKEINLQMTYEQDQVYMIKADRDRLYQILLNLITNAIKYTSPQGQVTVDINPWKDKGYSVDVKDTGVGIKAEEIPRIFERFYRVDKDRSRESGGTGLGLAIVKHLVEAHHGEIDVQSVEGEGSVFTVHFYRHPVLKD